MAQANGEVYLGGMVIPSLFEARYALAAIRDELQVCRDQPDPRLTDPFGPPGKWVGHVKKKIAELEAMEAETLGWIAHLEAEFA